MLIYLRDRRHHRILQQQGRLWLPPPLPAVPSPTVAAAAASEEKPPDDVLCPISQELMEDPVIAADGHTYERTAIESWLLRKATRPMSGNALETTATFPNHLLRRQIREWHEALASRSAAQRMARQPFLASRGSDTAQPRRGGARSRRRRPHLPPP